MSVFFYDSDLKKLWHEEENVDDTWKQVVNRAGKDHYVKQMVDDDIDIGDRRVSLDLIVVYHERKREVVEREEARAAETSNGPEGWSGVWKDGEDDLNTLNRVRNSLKKKAADRNEGRGGEKGGGRGRGRGRGVGRNGGRGGDILRRRSVEELQRTPPTSGCGDVPKMPRKIIVEMLHPVHKEDGVYKVTTKTKIDDVSIDIAD